MAPKQANDLAGAPWRCPVCRAAVEPDGPCFPFCSRRCKLIDLGRWLDERHRIEVPAEGSDEGAASGEPANDHPDHEGMP